MLRYGNGKKEIPPAEVLDYYIKRTAEGDKDSFSMLYSSTASSIYGLALSYMKNTHDAEDVVHDCFVSVWSAADDYISEGKPMAWLLTVAKNLCLQKLRERSKTSDIPQEDWETYLGSREDITAESKVIIGEFMAKLSEEEQKILVLYAVSGFKHREISDILGIPLATVLSKYNRAIKKLQKENEE